MIVSRYNLFIPSSRPDDFTLYNTLRGSLFLVNGNARTAIENGGDTLDEQIRDTLTEEGILMVDDIDETAIFRVLRNRAKYNAKSLSLVILSTYVCNLNCTYCFLPSLWKQWGKSIPKESMSVETTHAISTFAMNTTLENDYEEISIDFVGLGEPLSRPDSIVHIANELRPFASKNGITLKINIISNGTFASPELLERLRGPELHFQITLDGPKIIHNKRRMYKNKTGTYDRILKALELLAGFGIRFVIRVNIDKHNIKHVEELLDDLTVKLGTGLHIRFLPLLPIPDDGSAWLKSCMAKEDLSEIPRLWELASKKGFIVHVAPLVNYLSCRAMSDSSYVIDLFGDVYKCEGLVGNERFRIGTIDEKGRLSKLADAYYEWMAVDPLDTDDCRDCALLPACGGTCLQLMYLYTGMCHQDSCTKNKDFLIDNILFQLKRFHTDLS